MSEESARVRFMRLLVFFDLPVETAKQRKDYRQFRKFLINDGYLMLQESVYAKMVVTEAAAKNAIARMKKKRPPAGLVQVLRVSEKQYADMVFVTGEKPAFEEVDTMEGFLVL
jgi:CRISPR-associated protein Cas2